MIHRLHLTDDKLQSLALLGYLGNWLANAQSVPGEEPHPELYNMLQKIYKLAKEDRVKGMKIVHDFGEYSCTEHDGINSSVYDIIQDYDQQTMLEMVAHSLAERDVQQGSKSKDMTEEILFNLEIEKYDFYMDEFSKYGLARFSINAEL